MNIKSWFVAAFFVAELVLPVSTIAQTEQQPYLWQTIPFGGGGYVDGFVYHPKQKDLLYARTDVGGLYRYDFDARQWIPLLDYLGHDDADLKGVLSVAIDPNDPQKVYAACGLYLASWARKGAILRSDDQGRTWQKTELPIRVGGNSDGRGTGERLVVDPKNGNILYFGSNQDGLWKSTDGGGSFDKADSSATSISLVAIDSKNGNIYLGSADGQGALLVSHDGGHNFEPVPETPQQVPQRLAFAPGTGSIYVTFSQGDAKQVVNPSYAVRGSVWKRDVTGQWSDVSPLVTDNNNKFGFSGVDVGPDGTVAISTLDRWWPGDDVFLSHDGGAHWIGLADKSHHDTNAYPWLIDFTQGREQMGNWISDVKINPFNKDELIYPGPWVSRDLSDAVLGKTIEWDLQTNNLEEMATMQLVSPTQGPKVMAAMGDEAGGAWYDITKLPALFHPAQATNRSIDYAGMRPSFMVRVSDGGPTHGYYSEDGAKSWAPISDTPYKTPKEGREWQSPGMMAVSAKGTSLVWTPEKDTAYYSLDMGKTWKESAGWPSERDQSLIVVSDKVIDNVFYVFDRAGNILASADGGANFKVIVSGLPKVESWERAQLAIVPGYPRDFWLAAPYGLLHSPDSQTAMTGMKNVNAAWAVGFGAPLVHGEYPAIYLWGKVRNREGIWRSDDEGASWVRINNDSHQFGSLDGIAGDMREPGTVYIAPGARGLMVGKPAR